jgi:F-type H+-transporting ATPase subunit gamma
VSDSTAVLRPRIESATELQAVVRTMKAVAASSIGQYEQSVRALGGYERTIGLGLGASLRAIGPAALRAARRGATRARVVNAVVFGSDQALVGRFNDVVADHAVATLAGRNPHPRVWAVGERVTARLVDAGLTPAGQFAVPTSVATIAPLVAQMLVDAQRRSKLDADSELLLFHNSRAPGAGTTSVVQRLLPLDGQWRRAQAARPWPTKNLPQVVGGGAATLAALVGEYLFVSMFRACAESLATENASRLSAMERADRNIDELLAAERGSFHRLRQEGIDEELFDVIAGFEALGRSRRAPLGSDAEK